MTQTTFWGSKNSQPKRQHRFLFSFGKKGQQNQLPSWVVSNVTRPTVEVSTVEHQYINHSFKFPGRAKWNDITVTLKDPLTPDASQQLYSLLREAGYYPPVKGPEDKTMKQSFTKKSFADAIGDIKIQALNAAGDPVETWTLNNPIIVSVDWGSFDYASEELVELSLTIAYDWAEITGA